MKLRAFAAGWTVFTVLAAPALLAADEPAPVPPAGDPALGAPAPAPTPAATEPAPAPPATEPAPAPEPVAAEPAPTPEPVAAAQPAREEDSQPARPRKKPKARAAASTSVGIKDFEFSPKSVTINVGDTVTWSNSGPTEHTATGPGFDTGLLKKGESGSHTFSSAGEFAYICTPHPFMKASVTVLAASSGSDADSDSAGASADDGDDGPSLPATGADAWALALLGTGLLSLGVAVRRRSDSA